MPEQWQNFALGVLAGWVSAVCAVVVFRGFVRDWCLNSNLKERQEILRSLREPTWRAEIPDE